MEGYKYLFGTNTFLLFNHYANSGRWRWSNAKINLGKGDKEGFDNMWYELVELETG